MLERMRAWAQRLKRDALTLWFACRDPATPWVVKGLCMVIVAYALSPIDLIPDFIPVLGYLDDALLLPGLIWLALRLLPTGVATTSRAKADAWVAARGAKPSSKWGAMLIIALWAAMAYASWRWWKG